MNRINIPQQYYVYAHYKDDERVYIGKGKDGRFASKREYNYDQTEVLMDNLTEDEAIELERFVLSTIGTTKFNKFYPKEKQFDEANKKYGDHKRGILDPYGERGQAKFLGVSRYYAKKLTGIIKTKYNTKKQK